jgi:hypothetical protein
MLKNKRKPHIVSRLFDTINNMSIDEDACEDENKNRDTSEIVRPNYIISVPNENQPLKMTPLKPVVMCVYQVRSDGPCPYILFLLQKHNAEFSFITFSGTSKKMKYTAISQMKRLLPGSNLTYAGFSETRDETIIILKYTENIISDDTEYTWATPFEIINTRKIGQYSVSKKVFDFFIANREFLTLKTPHHDVYESPMIGYAFSDQHKLEEMDIYRETIIPTLGKCYYLLVDLPENSTKNIMRIAFFAGKMLVYDIKQKYVSTTYDSLLCDKKYYIIQHYDQHVLLDTANKIL